MLSTFIHNIIFTNYHISMERKSLFLEFTHRLIIMWAYEYRYNVLSVLELCLYSIYSFWLYNAYLSFSLPGSNSRSLTIPIPLHNPKAITFQNCISLVCLIMKWSYTDKQTQLVIIPIKFIKILLPLIFLTHIFNSVWTSSYVILNIGSVLGSYLYTKRVVASSQMISGLL